MFDICMHHNHIMMNILWVIGFIFDFFDFFQNRELQIMRKLEHQNIVKLKFFFYSAGEKVS